MRKEEFVTSPQKNYQQKMLIGLFRWVPPAEATLTPVASLPPPASRRLPHPRRASHLSRRRRATTRLPLSAGDGAGGPAGGRAALHPRAPRAARRHLLPPRVRRVLPVPPAHPRAPPRPPLPVPAAARRVLRSLHRLSPAGRAPCSARFVRTAAPNPRPGRLGCSVDGRACITSSWQPAAASTSDIHLPLRRCDLAKGAAAFALASTRPPPSQHHPTTPRSQEPTARHHVFLVFFLAVKTLHRFV
jgi:hypothetical protein